MRQGGVNPTFSSRSTTERTNRYRDHAARRSDGRVDDGILAAFLLEPLRRDGALAVTGSASMPGGASAALQFLPAGITVR